MALVCVSGDRSALKVGPWAQSTLLGQRLWRKPFDSVQEACSWRSHRRSDVLKHRALTTRSSRVRIKNPETNEQKIQVDF